MNRLLQKALLILCVVGLGLLTLVPSTRVLSETNNTSVILNGLISKDTAGRTDEKTATLATGSTVKATYSLVPQYAEGFTQGTKVHIFLPSFDYDSVSDTYIQRHPSDEPSALGISARISADDTWEIEGNGTQNGGWVTLAYSGNLIAGSNPAFEISFSAYADGTAGPMGALPEGTVIDVHGYVEYENYNSQPNSAWKTSDSMDKESVLKLISSNLQWEANIEYFDSPNPAPIPMWDRYQYIDYRYEISNTSSNAKSMVEGYTVTFDIDSSEDSINGILPFDINLWRVNENGEVVVNEDRTDFNGSFIGVKDKGGILIYDITDHKEGDPMPDPLPYTYSGVGVIALDQSKDLDKINLYSPTSGQQSKRIYKVSIPLSRQGFPNLPTMFNVSAITNIIFAKNQNWSKTNNMALEIVEPEYRAGIEKTGPNASVYGAETSYVIKNIVNRSNVPVFDVELLDTIDPFFEIDRLVLKSDDWSLFDTDHLLYLVDTVKDEKTGEVTHIEKVQKGLRDGDTLTFDLSDYETNDLWDRNLRFELVDSLNVAEFVPLEIELFGIPYKIGKLNNEARLKFNEKIANNTDYSKPTSYQITENTKNYDTHDIEVVYPDPVKPQTLIILNQGVDGLRMPYDSSFNLDIQYGVNNMQGKEASFVTTVNDATKALGLEIETLTIKPSIHEPGNLTSLVLKGTKGEVSIPVVDIKKDSETILDLSDYNFGDLLSFEVNYETFISDGLITYITLDGHTAPTVARTHPVTTHFVVAQGSPYNNTVQAKDATNLSITYPQELKVNASLSSTYATSIATAYYPTSTNVYNYATLSVPYEGAVVSTLNATTNGVLSPKYSIHFTYGTPSKDGDMLMNQFEVLESVINASSDFNLEVTRKDGSLTTYLKSELATSPNGLLLNFDALGIDDVVAVSLNITDFKNTSSEALVKIYHDANTDLGSTQDLNATIQGSQNMPYTSDAKGSLKNTISVPDTKTSISMQAFHQEGQALGSSSFSEYVYRQRYYGYNYYNDYTLDIPYKSLGGFSASLSRPTTLATNIDEKVAVTVDVPDEQFDLYSIRLKASLQPYLQSVEIYRMIDGVSTLWKTIEASAWVGNAQDGAQNFRINTAYADLNDEELYLTQTDGLALEHHPYYKEAWSVDVKPESPVDKVIVNLKFDHEHGKTPQLAGNNNNVIDVLGRFYEVSKSSKKPTTGSTLSEIGIDRSVERTSATTIYTAVHHSVALSETGAQDEKGYKAGTEGVQEKVVRMGHNGHFLVGIKNSYNTLGPFNTSNPLISVGTEYNEFIYKSDNTFHHDTLVYTMTLPQNYSENNTYYFDFTEMELKDAVYKYMTSINFINANGDVVNVTKDELQSLKTIGFDVASSVNGLSLVDGVASVSFGDGSYVDKVEVIFEEIPGFADSNSEVKGRLEDILGARLAATDIRFTGGVYGNQRLTGTSTLHRQYTGSTQRTLLGTSDAVLIGYTPKLGASVSIAQDASTMHDYLEDGLTPTQARYRLDVWNANEVDIKKVELKFRADGDFRAKKIQIPASIFAGTSWKVSSVHVASNNETVSVNTQDLKALFVLNPDNNMYELDIESAFDAGVLSRSTYSNKYGDAVYNKDFVGGIIAVFEPIDTLLYGSLSREDDATLSNHILADASEMIVSGIYVDESETNVWDYTSKPSFAHETTKPTQNTNTESISNNVSAFVTSNESVYVNYGSTNNSQTPSVSITGYLMNRVARLQLEGTAIDSNRNPVTADNQFYDLDTQTRISNQRIALGDETEQVFEIRNTGSNGNLPVFNPYFVFQVPQGMELKEVEIIGAEDLVLYESASYLESQLQAANLNAITINGLDLTTFALEDITQLRNVSINFNDSVLDFNQSFAVRIKLEVVDTYAAGTIIQNKTITWNAFARPDMTHGYMSYDISGVAGNLTRVGVASTSQNLDSIAGNEYYAVISNNDYRFANPNQAAIVDAFVSENISGEKMTIETQNVLIETEHDHNDVVQEIIFDTKGLKGFELTAFPEINYPTWMQRTQRPELEILDDLGNWSSINYEDINGLVLESIQGVRITYRDMPHLDDAGNLLQISTIKFNGIAHWRSATPSAAKSYVIESQMRVTYTHNHPDMPSTFEQVKKDSVTVYKAIPLVSFNLQSFDTKAEALEFYNANDVAKTTYRPKETIWKKLTATNISRNQGTSSTDAFGKAPLNNPVIVDRIPEYLLIEELEAYIVDGTFNIAKAIEDGVVTMRMNAFSEAERAANSTLPLDRQFKLPTVTVHQELGYDIGGSQSFDKSNTKDGSGYLSNNNASPSNLGVNPAKQITYTVFTYQFEDEQIDRGGRLEVVYPTKARHDDLPYATYSDDGRTVYAPYIGWNTGTSPVHSDSSQTIMSMASLLHDAGITGEREDYILEGEFLAESYAYLHGTNTLRYNTDIDNETYYDDSANMNTIHVGYLKDATNTSYKKEGLYVTRSSSIVESDNSKYVTRTRLSDALRPTTERMIWTQDGLNLSRGWLYSASQMVPKQERTAHDVDYNSNFYEHDGNLSEYDIRYHGATPYKFDNYTYAVQLKEAFNIRMYVSNYGDFGFTNGVVLTEILPLGISPYVNGETLNLSVKIGDRTLDASEYTARVIQTPQDTNPQYLAPAQSQEYGTYETTRDQGVPYVVQIEVHSELGPWFNRGTDNTYSLVANLEVVVEEERQPKADTLSYWYDELRVEPAGDPNSGANAYYEIYDGRYGGLTTPYHSYNRTSLQHDAVTAGQESNVTLVGTGYYSDRNFIYEPYTEYIRGLNAQTTTEIVNGKKVSVSGDQIAMRKPTLRLWTQPINEADEFETSINGFTADLYDSFDLNVNMDNFQFETSPTHYRNNPSYTGNYANSEHWVYQPQTIGGAKGSWFEPVITVDLPYGIIPEPLMTRSLNNIVFTASTYTVNASSRTVIEDVTDLFNVREEAGLDDQNRPVVRLVFELKDKESLVLDYGQGITITPRVKVTDVPDNQDATNATNPGGYYDDVVVKATSSRPVFNPIVPTRYQTGSVPVSNTYTSYAGGTIGNNDRKRLDSSSLWSGNSVVRSGAMAINQRLIYDTTVLSDETTVNKGAQGSTRILGTLAHINNTTGVGLSPFDMLENVQVDAAGKYWHATTITNDDQTLTNKLAQAQQGSDVYHSDFLLSYYIAPQARLTGKYQFELSLNGERVVVDQDSAKALGISIKRVDDGKQGHSDGRQHVQFKVQLPVDERLGYRGRLDHLDSLKFTFEAQIVRAVDADIADGETWISPELNVESYVSLIPVEDTPARQIPQEQFYTVRFAEGLGSEDVDMDNNRTSVFAQDGAKIEVIKPKGLIRKNTTRPRILYSNGKSGDNYFNSSEVIEFMITHAENTGSGVKEMIVEDRIPTDSSNDPSQELTDDGLNTRVLYLSTGNWTIPDSALQDIVDEGYDPLSMFKVYVYVSEDLGEFEFNDVQNWTLLNPSGANIKENIEIALPTELQNLKQVRWVVRAIDPDNVLIPHGFKLDIDTDTTAEGVQTVYDTDPDNAQTASFGSGVKDNAIRLGLIASSDVKHTLYLHNEAKLWLNFVDAEIFNAALSKTRSYLTPSRPVVNIDYDARYYRRNVTSQTTEDRFSWSEVMIINPTVSPHLKFKATFTNADESMWVETESDIYQEDTLIDPHITLELPKTVTIDGSKLKLIPFESINATNPLSEEYKSQYALVDTQANMWTWRIERAPENLTTTVSELELISSVAGSWGSSPYNVMNIGFKGTLYPGDKVIIEVIGTVSDYAPGSQTSSLQSSAKITNNTGLLQPLNSVLNVANKLGYELDNYDYNNNKMINDRVVFAERQLFEYSSYDNFSKRKTVITDLNPAGTVHPAASAVSEGGVYRFETSLDNSKEENANPYPYPIIYDILPHLDDKLIMQDKARNSMFEGTLLLNSIKLVEQGATNKVYSLNEYDVFVGPFTKQGNTITRSSHPNPELANTQEFYFDMIDAMKRNQYFVNLKEIQNNPELVDQIESILILFKDPNAKLAGQRKLVLSYEMKAPLNTLMFNERTDSKDELSDYTSWNSFVGTQKVDGFKPQESNLAGVYVSEMADKTYIGNYVWMDVNTDTLQNEGEIITDMNGRKLLQNFKDLDGNGIADDPGINGVKVTLLSPNGYYMDMLGQSIKNVKGEWLVVNDATGEPLKDDVFNDVMFSKGPVSYITENDAYGNAGYYTLSNISEGSYRLLFEVPTSVGEVGVTTFEMYQNTGLTVYDLGDNYSIAGEQKTADGLKVITETFTVKHDTKDEQLMSFDLGLGNVTSLGGTIFLEDESSVDGIYDTKLEKGIPNYRVELLDANGNIVKNLKGDAASVLSDANGNYTFEYVPFNKQYTVKVTQLDAPASRKLTPYIFKTNPLLDDQANDGYMNSGVVVSHPFILSENDKDATTVDFGFYDTTRYASIGNRVWLDENRDGIQDDLEPGVPGQVVSLYQFVNRDGEWVQNPNFNLQTTTNADGYYYFNRLATTIIEGSEELLVAYDVKVESLPEGHTFTLQNIGDEELDSDFGPNGLRGSYLGENLIKLQETLGGEVVYRMDIDLGLVTYDLGSIAGNVFEDKNQDDLFNQDLLLDMYTMTLQVEVNGSFVTVVVDENGNMVLPHLDNESYAPYQITGSSYKFEGLHALDPRTNLPYSYRVIASPLVRNHDLVNPNVGLDDTFDSDFELVDDGNETMILSHTMTLAVESKLGDLLAYDGYQALDIDHVDMGIYVHKLDVLIGDYVYNDANQNGMQDADELGVEGVRLTLQKYDELLNEWVEIKDLNGNSSVVTDENGYYEFLVVPANLDETAEDYLIPYQYRVVIEKPVYSLFAPYDALIDDTVNSDVVEILDTHLAASRVSVHGTLTEGKLDIKAFKDDVNVDFGLILVDPYVSIGDKVWVDSEANAYQDDKEIGAEGIEVLLFRVFSDNTIQLIDSTTTDQEGYYNFEVLAFDGDENSPEFMQAIRYSVGIRNSLKYDLVKDMAVGDTLRDSNAKNYVSEYSATLSDWFTMYDDLSNVYLNYRDDYSIDFGIIPVVAQIERPPVSKPGSGSLPDVSDEGKDHLVGDKVHTGNSANSINIYLTIVYVASIVIVKNIKRKKDRHS